MSFSYYFISLENDNFDSCINFVTDDRTGAESSNNSVVIEVTYLLVDDTTKTVTHVSKDDKIAGSNYTICLSLIHI